MGGVDSPSSSPGSRELPPRSSHHLALVQDSSSSKPWADNGPFQAARCLEPARDPAVVSPPAGAERCGAPAQIRHGGMPAPGCERKAGGRRCLVPWGDAPAAHTPAPGGAASPLQHPPCSPRPFWALQQPPARHLPEGLSAGAPVQPPARCGGVGCLAAGAHAGSSKVRQKQDQAE